MTDSKISVYLIDDSEEHSFFVEDLLSEIDRIGEVTSFLDPEKALEDIIQKDEDGGKLPDLIFLDVRMPELDGFELIDELDQQFKEFSPLIVMLTSSKHRKDVESFDKQLLSKELLSKPLSEEKVIALLEKYF